MGFIRTTIVGDTPLLMNNPDSMKPSEGGEKKKPPGASYDKEKEAAKRLYWSQDKSSLMVPGRCIHAMMIAGCDMRFKIGRYGAKKYVAGSVDIQPEEILLNTTKYEIDERTGVIKGNRIFIWRPKIMDWKLTFDIVFDEETWGEAPKMLIDILAHCGKNVGLLDYRPANKGKFGKFHIEKYEIN